MKRILVVDDDRDILDLMELMLGMNRFSVRSLSNWENINESIAHFLPDLILLDVALGGADGREICKQLKQSRETKHIPIILFSAHAEMGNNYRDFHAQAFIAKPFEMADLLRTVRAHVN